MDKASASGAGDCRFESQLVGKNVCNAQQLSTNCKKLHEQSRHMPRHA